MLQFSLDSVPNATVNSCAISQDNSMIVACHGSTVNLYDRNGLAFERATFNAGSITPLSSAFSFDGVYLAIGSTGAPYISIFKKSDGLFSKLSNPDVLPTGAVNGCCFSPDGTYLAVACSASPYVIIYKRSGDAFTKLSNPSTLPAYFGQGCSFSPDGLFLAVAHNNSPYITIYSRSGDTFTKLSNPTTLPTNNGKCCDFSADGLYLAVGHFVSPYITIYERSGSTFTAIDDPDTLPGGTVCACSFARGTNKLLISYIPSSTSDKRGFVYEYADSAFGLIAYSLESFTTVTSPYFGVCGGAISNDGSIAAWGYSDLPFLSAYNLDADSIPLQPTLISPNGNYVGVNETIEFSWEHNIIPDASPTGADLQYKNLTNGDINWSTLASVYDSSTSVTIAADTFVASAYQWRARTYNADGVSGEWSDHAPFVGVGYPLVPTITGVSECNRPVVTWTSTGQTAYRVQIGDYDTGEVNGTAKTHKLPHYIANGEYIVRVAILNASRIRSEWAEYTLTLDVTGPEAPIITATEISGAASLTLSATGAEHLYLLRDGVPVADVTGLMEHTDYAALGTVSYVLRAVDADDNYTDSAPASVIVSVPYVTLAAVDALSQPLTLMLTRGEPPRISGSIGQVVTYRYYAGRKKPVAVFADQKSEAYQISVTFLQQSDSNNLTDLLDRCMTMLYRDNWGNRWYVTIPSTGYEQDDIATSMPLSMTVVDYVEAIQYAEV